MHRAAVRPDTSELLHEIDPCPSSRRRRHHPTSLGSSCLSTPSKTATCARKYRLYTVVNSVRFTRKYYHTLLSSSIFFGFPFPFFFRRCFHFSASLTCDSAFLIYEIPWSRVDHMGPETRDQNPESRTHHSPSRSVLVACQGSDPFIRSKPDPNSGHDRAGPSCHGSQWCQGSSKTRLVNAHIHHRRTPAPKIGCNLPLQNI
ncbi:hypothetical protein F4810DRAFT_675739 [Camillea tinctor]|nr:hypothetical protein F4810DRAFT_675739 [Camillea tinctor]